MGQTAKNNIPLPRFCIVNQFRTLEKDPVALVDQRLHHVWSVLAGWTKGKVYLTYLGRDVLCSGTGNLVAE